MIKLKDKRHFQVVWVLVYLGLAVYFYRLDGPNYSDLYAQKDNLELVRKSLDEFKTKTGHIPATFDEAKIGSKFKAPGWDLYYSPLTRDQYSILSIGNQGFAEMNEKGEFKTNIRKIKTTSLRALDSVPFMSFLFLFVALLTLHDYIQQLRGKKSE